MIPDPDDLINGLTVRIFGTGVLALLVATVLVVKAWYDVVRDGAELVRGSATTFRRVVEHLGDMRVARVAFGVALTVLAAAAQAIWLYGSYLVGSTLSYTWHAVVGGGEDELSPHWDGLSGFYTVVCAGLLAAAYAVAVWDAGGEDWFAWPMYLSGVAAVVPALLGVVYGIPAALLVVLGVISSLLGSSVSWSDIAEVLLFFVLLLLYVGVAFVAFLAARLPLAAWRRSAR